MDQLVCRPRNKLLRAFAHFPTNVVILLVARGVSGIEGSNFVVPKPKVIHSVITFTGEYNSVEN